MRYVIKSMAVILLLFLLSLGTALAVGFEKYDISGAPDSSNRALENGAMKQSSIIDKAPAAIDEITFFVRDILGQFGLGEIKGE
jgi:hypothetical protein